MKKRKRIFWILLAAAALLFVLFRYGWRVFGFSACDSPTDTYVDRIAVEGDTMLISGGAASSMTAYVGYRASRSEDKLYLGIRHNGFLGFFQRRGDFQIEIPNAGGIREVFLKGAGNERLVWTKQEGLIQNPPSEQGLTSGAAPTASDEPIVEAGYPFDGADAENDLCAVLYLGDDQASADASVQALCEEYGAIRTLFDSGDPAVFDAKGAEQFLILPKYAGTSITVTEVQLDDGGSLKPAPGREPLTAQTPVRILANPSDIAPSTEITLRLGEESITFSPMLSLKDGSIAKIDGAYTRMLAE